MRVGPAHRGAFVSDDFSGDNIGGTARLKRCRAVVPQTMKTKSAALPRSIAASAFLFISPPLDYPSAGHESVKFVRKSVFFPERNSKALGNSGASGSSFDATSSK